MKRRRIISRSVSQDGIIERAGKVICPHCGKRFEVTWQDEGRTITSVEQVYDTRWDCMAVPG